MRVCCPACGVWHHTLPDRTMAHCPACGARFPLAQARAEPEAADDPAVRARIDAELARQREGEGG